MFLALSLLLLPAVAGADQIREEMAEQVKKYEAGDIPGALDSARLIEAWLLELQAEGLSGVWGEVAGWSLEVGESQAAGMAMMGGGVTTSATYTKDDMTMTGQIIANSPMLSMVTSMLGNSFLATSSGSKIMKIDGRKVMVEQNGDEWKLSVPYQNTVLLTVEGPDKDAAVKCVERIDWAKVDEQVMTQ
jgi:hypothetical protein